MIYDGILIKPPMEELFHYGVKGMKWRNRPGSRKKNIINGSASIKKVDPDEEAYIRNVKALHTYRYNNDLRYKMGVDSDNIRYSTSRYKDNITYPKKRTSIKGRGQALPKRFKKIIDLRNVSKVKPKVKKPSWIK